MAGLGVGCAAVSVAFFGFLALIAAPIWGMVIEPWREAQDLYAAADEARSRAYVEDAEVYLDWLDGNYLAVYLTPDATAADAKELWCDILLDAEGGRIDVYQGYAGEHYPPKRRACATIDTTR